MTATTASGDTTTELGSYEALLRKVADAPTRKQDYAHPARAGARRFLRPT